MIPWYTPDIIIIIFMGQPIAVIKVECIGK